jgi:hypothetical protein
MPKKRNSNLHSAKAGKRDEFYTQIEDIQKEVFHYKEHFKGKVVFLNCDDPQESHFWLYFQLNFDFLGLKKLIATHYEDSEPSYKLELNGYGEEPTRTPLEQNGDFRSPECIELLKEADIVVTNPPFSLFREYVAQLMEYDKKFLIMGNKNACTYKEMFQLFQANKVWTGVTCGQPKWFRVPEHYMEGKTTGLKIIDGVSYCNISGLVWWYTNLPHKSRNEELLLSRTYKGNEHLYPRYDNYDAIEVSKTVQIPNDYEGVMGVPITFLIKHNPDQFEILGVTESEGKGLAGEIFHGGSTKQATVVGKKVYKRIFIRHKNPTTNTKPTETTITI